MYGMLCHLFPKQGQEQAVLDHLFRWEQEYLPGVTGSMNGYIFEPVAQAEAALTPEGILLIVVFDSSASSIRNRENPEQARWEQCLQDLLEQASEWHEGEMTELFAEAHGL